MDDSALIMTLFRRTTRHGCSEFSNVQQTSALGGRPVEWLQRSHMGRTFISVERSWFGGALWSVSYDGRSQMTVEHDDEEDYRVERYYDALLRDD